MLVPAISNCLDFVIMQSSLAGACPRLVGFTNVSDDLAWTLASLSSPDSSTPGSLQLTKPGISVQIELAFTVSHQSRVLQDPRQIKCAAAAVSAHRTGNSLLYRSIAVKALSSHSTGRGLVHTPLLPPRQPWVIDETQSLIRAAQSTAQY